MRWVACIVTLVVAACDGGQEVPDDAGVLDASEALVAPTVMASPGDSQVAVSWTQVPYAERYRVGRADSPNGTRTIIETTSADSVVDHGVTNGVTYYYAVQPANTHGDGPWSAEISARPVDVLPVAPTGVSATAGRTKVTLSWQTASDADDYLVKRATSAGGPYAVIHMTAAPPHVDLDVVDNTTYFYVVVARNTGGESAPSTEASARPTDLIPASPANVSVLAGDNETTVMWDPATAATSYLVESAASATGTYSLAGLVSGRSLTIRWGSFPWIRVRGVSAAGVGDPSPAVQRIATGAELASPRRVRGVVGSDAVSLRWDSVTSATSYRVLRGTAPGGPYTEIATISGTRHVDAGLAPGTYHYVIRTANEPSANSNEVTATVEPTLPALPTGLTVDANQYFRNTLTWNPVPGATRYVVRTRHTESEPLVVAEPVSPTYTHSTYYGDPWQRYAVSAVIGDVEGPETAEIQVDNGSGPAMSTLTAHRGSDRIALTFSSPPEATEQSIYRAAGEAAAYVPVWTGLAREWNDDDVVAGARYRYRIRAATPTGMSWSEEITVELDVDVPARPTDLAVAQVGYEWTSIAWSAVPGATGYTIYRAEPNNGFARVGHATTPSFLDSWVQRAPVRYVVTAYASAGESAPSDPLSVATAAAPPRAPESVAADAGDGVVHVTWAPGPAEDFRLGRATTPGGPYDDLGTFLYEARDTSVTNGTTYYYVVRAIAGGVEVASAEVSATPAASGPIVLSTQSGDQAVSLSWTHVPAASYYNIYRAESAGATTLLTTWSRADWIDPYVVNGTTYYYRISAVTSAGETPLSNEVSTTPDTGGQAPVDVVASSGTEAHLAWTASPDATSYRVWRAERPSAPYVAIADVPRGPYLDATPGQHWYVVTAIGANGTSIPSPQVTAYVVPAAMPRVSGVTADATGGKLIVRWNPIGGATEYDVCWTTSIGAPRACTTTRRTNMALRTWTPGVPLSIWVRVHRDDSLRWSPSDEVVVTPQGGAPPIPTLFARSGNGQVALEWLPSAGATSYRIWRADGPGRPMEPYLVTDRAFAVPEPVGSRTTWAISAINGSFESSWSVEQDAASVAFVPPIPSVTVTAGAGSIMFDVGPTDEYTVWEVARSASPHYNFVDVPIETKVRGRLVVAASPGTAYYRIRGCFLFGNCGGGHYVAVAPSPTALAAPTWIDTIEGNGEITVTWEPVPGATAYRVFRGPGYSLHRRALEPIAVVTAGAYTDRDVSNESDYIYAVSAIGPGGESTLATSSYSTPDARHPKAPTNVTASASATSITVDWEPSVGATSYSVCRATTAGGARTCTSASAPPHVDSAVGSGATYYYSVTAQSGAYSNVVAATVP